MKRTKRGVFCIEGEFDTEALSFEPTLALLSDAGICDFSKIYRKVQSRGALVKSLEQWAARGDWKYPVLYLSFHGFEHGVHVDDPKGAGFTRVDLRTISDVFDKYVVTDTVVHFGACSTLATDDAELGRFLRNTEVAALSGYQKDVPWIESLAFELLYLSGLQEAMASSERLDPELVARYRDTLYDSRKCHGLLDALGFRMVVPADFHD